MPFDATRAPPGIGAQKGGFVPFQMPVTIASALRKIQGREFVLPAIQREFVWGSDQIARLFDSILRGYPIGSFLSWTVDGKHSSEFKFFGFIKDYHQRDAPHCPVLDIESGRAVIAILDGQQRLTALNIGLRGSHAARLHGKWWNKPSSYPKQRLYLNICAPAPENELGMKHDFRFFTDPPSPAPDKGAHWFPVHRIFDISDATELHDYLVDSALGGHKEAFRLLTRLLKAVHDDLSLYFYEETDQDLDKVLDIFIRVNSAGTVLSHSDLLLSIATAQWSSLDAREEIHSLVDELNHIGQGFAFSKDVVLKAGLVLTEVGDVGFKVSNFNRENMAKLEKNWREITAALRLAVGLLADFGFSAETLTATSVLIPVSYYVASRGLTEDYRTSSRHDGDRRMVRHWTVRTLLKAGVWGAGLDTLLKNLRQVIAASGSEGFPVAAIEQQMNQQGKSLSFTEEEIADLAETPYAGRLVYPLLAILFPHVDTRNLFHVDHVFPRSMFAKTQLLQAGVPAEAVEDFRLRVNGLPNLQLLEGRVNIEKQASLPLTWARKKYGDGLDQYLLTQELIDLPESIADFLVFYEGRKTRLATRLRGILGVPPQAATVISLPFDKHARKAWLLLVFGGRRRYAGNQGYDDDPTRVYRYDSFVPNYKRLAAGDLVALTGPEEMIGFARIASVESRDGEKKRFRCPICQTSSLGRRETREPAYRCENGHEIAQPIEETALCRLFDAKLEQFVSTPGLIEIEELRKACVNYVGQLAMQEIDVGRLHLPFERFPALLSLFHETSPSNP